MIRTSKTLVQFLLTPTVGGRWLAADGGSWALNASASALHRRCYTIATDDQPCLICVCQLPGSRRESDCCLRTKREARASSGPIQLAFLSYPFMSGYCSARLRGVDLTPRQDTKLVPKVG